MLTHAGRISAQIAEQLALERYTQFDKQRRHAERLAADMEDAKQLAELEHTLQRHATGKKRRGT